MAEHNMFVYSWHVDDDNTEETIIRAYGVDSDKKNVCVRINNFTPYCYIELPTSVKSGGGEIPIHWNETNTLLVLNKLETMMASGRSPSQDGTPVFIKKSLMFKKRLFYASFDKDGERKKFPYLFVSMQTKDLITKLGWRVKKPIFITNIGNINLRIHETDASPILQLISLKQLPTAGWIKFVGTPVPKENQISWCDKEFKVRWQALSEDLDKISSVGDPLVMSFDIEVNSSNPNMMPSALKPNDKVFQLSAVFSRTVNKQQTKVILTLGKTNAKDVSENLDVEIIHCKTEADVLNGYKDLIQRFQPNVIIGYNIFKFDIPYMIDRAQHCMCDEFDMQGMIKYDHAKKKTIKWSSSAFKNQEYDLLDAEGRLFVDLYPIVLRDVKLSDYKLSTVATKFVGATKDPLDHKGIFKCYELGMKGIAKNATEKEKSEGRQATSICAKYCLQDSSLVLRLFHTLTTWTGLCEMAKVCNVPIFTTFTQGQQIKVFSQVYKYALHNNMVVEKDGYVSKQEEHFIGATVFPPKAGLYQKVTPFDFSSLYPTTMIAFNICYSTLVLDDSISDDDCHVMEFENHVGCAHDPKVIKKNVLDEKITAYAEQQKELRRQRDLKCNKNIKDEFKIAIDSISKLMKPIREERVELKKSKPKHIICEKCRFRWIKKPMGVLPTILKNLLDARDRTKKEMKKVDALIAEAKTEEEKTSLSVLYNVYDSRQLALKISANSIYGSLGVSRGYLPFMPGAMCTTYKGRTLIEKAALSIQNDHGGVLIYGDSVTGQTPVIVRDGKNIMVRNIEDLCVDYQKYGEDKEFSFSSFEIWELNRWVKIKRVIRHKTNKRIFRVNTEQGCVDVTEDHSLIDENKKEIKPKDVSIGFPLLTTTLPSLTTPTKWIEDILNVVYNHKFVSGYVCQCVYMYLLSIGHSVKILGYSSYYKLIRMDKSHNFSNKIINIYELPSSDEQYVYDIEADGMFQAGVGGIVVHNTDSNYISFPQCKTAEECWNKAEHVATEVTKLFPSPINLAFEKKIYWEFFILTKKRYMSLTCKRDGTLDKDISKKGVLLARRDNCGWVRHVYEQVVNMIFSRKSKDEIVLYIISEINKLCTKQHPLKMFVMTKSVGNTGERNDKGELPILYFKNEKGVEKVQIGDYKVNALKHCDGHLNYMEKCEECYKKALPQLKKKSDEFICSASDFYKRSLPAQVQLAEKMRDRGQLVDAGSRIEYVITLAGGHTVAQSEKLEDVYYQYKHSNSVQLDYIDYLRQLANPLDQVIGVMYADLKEFVYTQYRLRLQQEKITDEIKNIFSPKLIFE